MAREPLVQASPVAANVFIWMSFFVALLNYIRFAREVIWQMCVPAWLNDDCRTEHTGVACFTVRHKDQKGQWVENAESRDR